MSTIGGRVVSGVGRTDHGAICSAGRPGVRRQGSLPRGRPTRIYNRPCGHGRDMPSRRELLAGIATVSALSTGCLGDGEPITRCATRGEESGTEHLRRVAPITGREEVSLGIVVSQAAVSNERFDAIDVRNVDGDLVSRIPLATDRGMSRLAPRRLPGVSFGARRTVRGSARTAAGPRRAVGLARRARGRRDRHRRGAVQLLCDGREPPLRGVASPRAARSACAAAAVAVSGCPRRSPRIRVVKRPRRLVRGDGRASDRRCYLWKSS